jgi:hypothetical protein
MELWKGCKLSPRSHYCCALPADFLGAPGFCAVQELAALGVQGFFSYAVHGLLA